MGQVPRLDHSCGDDSDGMEMGLSPKDTAIRDAFYQIQNSCTALSVSQTEPQFRLLNKLPPLVIHFAA
jgi:hypothetical protein